MNTHGIGVRPDEGALQPLGGEPIPASLHTVAGRGWIPRARYTAPVTGTGAPGSPSYSTIGYDIWNQKTT